MQWYDGQAAEGLLDHLVAGTIMLGDKEYHTDRISGQIATRPVHFRNWMPRVPSCPSRKQTNVKRHPNATMQGHGARPAPTQMDQHRPQARVRDNTLRRTTILHRPSLDGCRPIASRQVSLCLWLQADRHPTLSRLGQFALNRVPDQRGAVDAVEALELLQARG